MASFESPFGPFDYTEGQRPAPTAGSNPLVGSWQTEYNPIYRSFGGISESLLAQWRFANPRLYQQQEIAAMERDSLRFAELLALTPQAPFGAPPDPPADAPDNPDF